MVSLHRILNWVRSWGVELFVVGLAIFFACLSRFTSLMGAHS